MLLSHKSIEANATMPKNIVGAVSVYQQFIEDYGVTVFSLIAMKIVNTSIYNFSFFCTKTPEQ